MDIHVWCILASIFLASSQAIRFDLNPQKLYENNPVSALRSQKFGPKEIVLYLTPSQVKSLEASGAVVRSQAAEPEATTETQQQEPAAEEPQQNAEPEQAEQQTENGNAEEEIRPVSDLEEIFRILNEQIEGQQQTTETANEEQAEEEESNDEEESNEEDNSENDSDEDSEEESEEESNSESEEEKETENETEGEEEEEEEKKNVTEKPREVPARFRFVSKFQLNKKQEKYVAPIIAKKENDQANNYAYIRFLPNGQREEIRLQLVSTNEEDTPAEPNLEQEEQVNITTELPEQQQTIKSVTYEVTENPEEATPADEVEIEEIEGRLAALLTPLINHEKIAESITEQKKKLLQNELEIQTLLRELTQAPKHNDQKYAIEIERLRANLEKQNALAKAEALARSATTSAPVVKDEANKKKRRLVQSAKSGKKKTAPTTALARLTQLSEAKKAQTEAVKPTQKTEKQKAEKSAQLRIEKRVPSTTTKYVKVPKQYPVQRLVPIEVKREVPVTLPGRKAEKSRVLRPVWEH